jgi:putative spermidine/putrescine transport system permease protein
MTKKLVPYLLASPALVLIAALALGLSSVLGWSFVGSGGSPSLEQYQTLMTDHVYRGYFTSSLWLSAVSTIVALVLGFPVAYYMEIVASPSQRKLIFATLLAVFISDYVLRMFGLIIVLGRSGVVNTILVRLGIIDQPLRLMYNEFGVLVGLVAGILPFMILSLNGVIARLDRSLPEAASLLGARPRTILMQITLPLCIPGIVAGSMLSFLLSLNSFVTPMLLGGGTVDMIAVLIFDQAINLANLPLGAAAAMLLFLLCAGSVTFFNVLGERYQARFQK